jgi:hypothetical protein
MLAIKYIYRTLQTRIHTRVQQGVRKIARNANHITSKASTQASNTVWLTAVKVMQSLSSHNNVSSKCACANRRECKPKGNG